MNEIIHELEVLTSKHSEQAFNITKYVNALIQLVRILQKHNKEQAQRIQALENELDQRK